MSGDAVIQVIPGAGGIEPTAFAGMLVRMYERFAERKGFASERTEGGIIIRAAGGSLRAERGIHCLTRIAPHDPLERRHTSFAVVSVNGEDRKDGGEMVCTRRYVFDPYKLAEDGAVQSNDPETVLDGDLDAFLGGDA